MGRQIMHRRDTQAAFHARWCIRIFVLAIDESSQASLGFASGGSARNPIHPEWEKARADFDITHRFVNSLSYDIPIGKGKKFGSGMSSLADFLVGGWELQGIQSVNTGTPRTIRGHSLCNCTADDRRPDRVVGVPLIPSNQSASNWFNPAAFTDPAFGTFGNS